MPRRPPSALTGSLATTAVRRNCSSDLRTHRPHHPGTGAWRPFTGKLCVCWGIPRKLPLRRCVLLDDYSHPRVRARTYPRVHWTRRLAIKQKVVMRITGVVSRGCWGPPDRGGSSKPKPRWDVHFRGVEGWSGSRGAGRRPLIARRCGSGVSPPLSGWPDQRGSCRPVPAP